MSTYRYNRFRKRETVSTKIDPAKAYTNRELDEIAEQLLRDDSKSEICRECGNPGVTTGLKESRPQEATDGEGNQLVIDFTEYECAEEHKWFDGEGRPKGIGGDDPILFDEHFYSRRKREIYCNAGSPDPSIVVGLYNRTHPSGRKVNTKEQRKRHGASYYR